MIPPTDELDDRSRSQDPRAVDARPDHHDSLEEERVARSRSTIVLSGRVPALPGEIAQFAVPVELRLPGADELGVMLSSVTHAMRKSPTTTQRDIEDAEKNGLFSFKEWFSLCL